MLAGRPAFQHHLASIQDISKSYGRIQKKLGGQVGPGLVDLEAVHHQSNKQNLQQAFSTAEHHLGIPQLLDPEDVDVNSPDERSIATYLAVLRQAAEGHLPQDGKKLGEGPEDVQSLKKQPPLPSVQDSQRYTHGGVTKEDQACLTFITELQAWVDMNQKEVNATNFGEDLKEVATLVEEQNASHDAIEELRKSLEEAQQCKESLSASCRADYDKRFDVLQRSYNVLVSSSNKRRRQLQELLTFLRAATDKLTWLGSCEDRQVSLDWSDNCPQLNDRQEDYVLLMQEMARQDPAFHGILEQGEELLQEGHPACRLLEGYIDALQTQWSWLLQLDSCTETHLQKNAEYFQFFRDSQSLHQELTSLHDSLVQECSCDCDSDVARLSKALDSIQKKSECLSELHAGVAKLSKKADKVVQLKPRRADYVLESSIPICAICDYKQSNVTLVKNSMYKLEGLHENGKWSIQDSDGRHALVPSVCFIVPPPNVEAGERARRLEEQQLEVKHLFKQRKLDIEAILSWHHLQDTIKSINSWTPCSFQDLSEEVCNGVLDRLENQSSDFKEKIKGSRVFPPEKLWQLEKDASSCKHHYQALLNNLVSEENEEQTYRQLLTELQATGDRLMSLRDEVVQVVKEQSADSSLDNMPSMLTRQERLDQEVDNLGTRLDQIGQQCEPLLNHASRAPSQADLRAELDRCLQIRPHLSDLSTSSLDRLRSLKQVRSIMTGLELHLVKFETSLAEQSSVPTNAQAIEQYQQSVKGMRADLSRHSGTLQRLQDEVSRAHSATEGLSRLEPCAGNLEPVAEAARLLHQRWRDVGSQMDSRLCELDHLSLLLAEYRESYDCVIQWLLGVSAQQDLSQIRQGKSSRELQSHLIQQKALIAKVERTQEEVTRCHELSEKYCNAVKEYEAKLAAYRDLVESITGAVPDHRPTSSALNNIEKEVISLLDRYTSLLNLTKDNAKLLGEALQQAQENEFAETAVTHVQWITEMEERMTSMRVASLDQVHLLAGSPSEQTNQLLIESLQKKSMESPNGSLQDLLCLYDEVETKMKVNVDLVPAFKLILSVRGSK
uniref:Calponin-homology (CH) domain-containing protein n=1 Tax=Eptatretus burgeri TaxID=7764 RepID=A0A8C4RBD9_EPTBU